MNPPPRYRVTLLDAAADPNLFRPWFKRRETWAAWFAFLAALFALPMTPEQLAIYQQCTGRTDAPTAPAREGWLICGRRAGKSFMLALVAVFLATFKDYRPYLAPGEIATVMVVAADRRQARVIFRYIRALLLGVPMLARMVRREAAEELELSNGVAIEVHTASYRTTRGYVVVAALLDELGFWRTDDGSANPDSEVITALRPGMATVPGAMLLCASSPYAQRGALFDAFKRHYGKAGGPLIWKAPTRVMNCTVPQSVIDEAMERDPASAAAEYLAEFRTDVESYISREVVDSCTVAGRFELPRAAGVRYHGFVDPSGGSNDSMSIAVAHRQGDSTVNDAIREVRPPFSPDSTVADFATLLKSYGIARLVGDRYAGEWPRERFRKHGIEYVVADKPKSDLYRDLLPTLNSGRIELLDHKRLINQLCGLERRVARSGKDSIDHAPGAFDDVANAVAGVAAVVAKAARVQQVPLCAAVLISRPRSVPGSDYRDGTVSVAAGSPHRPSSTEEWYQDIDAYGVRSRW